MGKSSDLWAETEACGRGPVGVDRRLWAGPDCGPAGLQVLLPPPPLLLQRWNQEVQGIEVNPDPDLSECYDLSCFLTVT